MVFKFFFDRLVAALLLVVLSPIIVLISFLSLLSMGRPVFFTQKRPGRFEKIFTIYKMRTMTSQTGPDGQLLPDEARMTRFGVFLRKTSLDEVPQLFNVLIGQMSLVGPRPLLPEYLERYSDQQKKRHNMRPGITGLAQVTGRNTHTWEERLSQDVWYVENWSLWLDTKILFLTFSKVIGQSGVSEEGEATRSPFLGNRKEL